MLSKYCIIFENGESVKKIMKTTKAILRNNYESITWLEENDKRVKKFNKQRILGIFNNMYKLKKSF